MFSTQCIKNSTKWSMSPPCRDMSQEYVVMFIIVHPTLAAPTNHDAAVMNGMFLQRQS